ncbi:FRG domain-containing protein [Aeromonas salmonicida]
MQTKVESISELIDYVANINTKNLLVFRGEKQDYGETALFPCIYRHNYIESEDRIYRESQRYNDSSFYDDSSAFDRLSRIQHYSAPTRLIDVSEDLLSAIYFSIAEKEDNSDAVVYVFEIDSSKIKYYDSDCVSVISNLAKLPLRPSITDKSKEDICASALKRCKFFFNRHNSTKYLLHEIKEEKSYFEPLIEPEHIFSVQFVYPKLSSDRIKSQKGAFLLFGLNKDDASKSINLLINGELNPTVKSPIIKIHTIKLSGAHVKYMQNQLKNIGVKKSFIYPEIDKVSEYLATIYKD